MTEVDSTYYSYIMRFWKESGDEARQNQWRFVLKDPVHGQRVGFSSLDALTAYIKAQIEKVEDSA